MRVKTECNIIYSQQQNITPIVLNSSNACPRRYLFSSEEKSFIKNNLKSTIHLPVLYLCLFFLHFNMKKSILSESYKFPTICNDKKMGNL